VLAPHAPELELLADGGSVAVEAGWVSERFGERVETAVNVIGAELELPAALGWRIRLH
jgi:hypothetical protein